jgi:hypothetical protein
VIIGNTLEYILPVIMYNFGEAIVIIDFGLSMDFSE